MKKWFVLFSIYLLFSCNFHENIVLNEDNMEGNLLSRSITPMISPVFEWWDTTSISLLGINSPVTLPWYNGASTQIPSYMLRDYRPEDGWEMVYNYCINTSPGETGKNYVIFYNKFTGILRVFYYNNNDIISASTTFWKVTINCPTSLFNSIGTNSLLISNRFNNPAVYVSNLTTVPSKSVTRGWNCFDVELAYDDQLKNTNAQFSISAYNKTSGNIDLHGTINLESDGTIVTQMSSQYPGWVNNSSKAVGIGAKDFVEKKLKKTSLGKNVTSIISGGVASLVSSGAKWFLGSLVGKQDNTYNSSVQLTTLGNVTISGNIESLSTPNILPLANNPLPGCVKKSSDSFLPSYDKPLGVWGVEKLPKIHEYPQTVISYSNNTGLYQRNHLYYIHEEQLYYFYPDSLKIKINPAILDLVDHYETEIRCIFEEKVANPQYYNPFLLNDLSTKEGWSYGMKGSNEQFYTDTTIMVLDGTLSLRGTSGNVRGFVYCTPGDCGGLTERQFDQLREEKAGVLPWLPGFYLPSASGMVSERHLYYKVTVTLYPKSPYDTTPIVLMRTFSPTCVYGNDPHCQLIGWDTRKHQFMY